MKIEDEASTTNFIISGDYLSSHISVFKCYTKYIIPVYSIFIVRSGCFELYLVVH